MGFVYVVLILLTLFAVGAVWGLIRIKINRRKGIYPQTGNETIEDVKRLALSGNTDLAINVYRSIYGSSLKIAKQEIEKIKSQDVTTR
ncbi:hypothetical protein [uncultured Desulfobacter sp.]|uniref:hypothetical protein n=1 Tax=uncultured Desulfobacter sp. TaxID=240139 RepID=UPI0029F4BCD9|nr:hypothetical protein [uncultured Desulfobacter sp.]